MANAYLPVRPVSIARSSTQLKDYSDPNSFERVGKNSPNSVSEHNDWGIPHSSELEPLSPNRMPVPDRLPNGGRVTLVGAGPGDPGLLTMSAYKLLTENPDALVIADRLVSGEILDLIAGEVKVARKIPGCAELAQEEIYWWAHQALQEGRHVIRLKIGDPFCYGRGSEEVLLFRRLGVESKVIPVSTWMFAGFDMHADVDIAHTLQSGRLIRLFGSSVGRHSRHTPRRGQSSGHVYGLRPRRHVTRLDSVSRGTNGCLSHGRGSPPLLVQESHGKGWLSCGYPRRYCGEGGLSRPTDGDW